MAFFCTSTGIRLVAPGVHVSAPGGTVPAFDHADPVHHAAEHAAHTVLRGEARGDSAAPAPSTVEAAQRAAKAALVHAPQGIGVSGKDLPQHPVVGLDGGSIASEPTVTRKGPKN